MTGIRSWMCAIDGNASVVMIEQLRSWDPSGRRQVDQSLGFGASETKANTLTST
jgi:hypothetical protein